MFGTAARDDGDDVFDPADAFVPSNLPEPGPFLEDCRVLEGRSHAAFHRLTRTLFEARGVYDVTFGYNLARLNQDRRHAESGYRYAAESTPQSAVGDQAQDRLNRPEALADDARVLRAEFTPTTPFCPQSEQLTKGSFRAWNGLAERHEYDLVRVRVHPSHQRSVAINAALEALEIAYVEDGSLEIAANTAMRSGDEPATHGNVDDELDVPDSIESDDDVPF